MSYRSHIKKYDNFNLWEQPLAQILKFSSHSMSQKPCEAPYLKPPESRIQSLQKKIKIENLLAGFVNDIIMKKIHVDSPGPKFSAGLKSPNFNKLTHSHTIFCVKKIPLFLDFSSIFEPKGVCEHDAIKIGKCHIG